MKANRADEDPRIFGKWCCMPATVQGSPKAWPPARRAGAGTPERTVEASAGRDRIRYNLRRAAVEGAFAEAAVRGDDCATHDAAPARDTGLAANDPVLEALRAGPDQRPRLQ